MVVWTGELGYEINFKNHSSYLYSSEIRQDMIICLFGT